MDKHVGTARTSTSLEIQPSLLRLVVVVCRIGAVWMGTGKKLRIALDFKSHTKEKCNGLGALSILITVDQLVPTLFRTLARIHTKRF